LPSEKTGLVGVMGRRQRSLPRYRRIREIVNELV
jgi:hypothetical protein